MAVYNRIEKIEPDLVSQIVGYLWLKGYRNKDMIRLAFAPNDLIESLVQECKNALPSFKASLDQMVGSHISARHGRCLPPLCHSPLFLPLSYQSQYLDPQFFPEQLPAVPDFDFAPPPYFYTFGNGQYVNLEEHSNRADYTMPIQPNNFHYYESNPGPRTRSRCLSLPEVAVKSCNYHCKGYCKHGNRCRYLHGETSAEGHSGIKELASDDYTISAGSLEKLEVELIELLKCRGGRPIPIATLPMLYNAKYEMILKGSGYLTDGQRHGKSGCSLLKLLASLNCIRILERPHGQYSIALAKDFPSRLMNWDERTGPGNVVSGSLQIYLTFPAESTFTEIDVSNYFEQYGNVQAVRIPAQQKRMFGFVSFVRVDTVETILLRPNPHYICSARVLVKPYREKTRLHRKFGEHSANTVDSSLEFFESDARLRSTSRAFSTSKLLRQQLSDENKLEVQVKYQSELQLAPRPFAYESYLSNTFDYRRNAEASHGSVDALKIVNINMSADGSFPNCDSDQIVLPENPFASTVAGSNISLK